jgi:hypothetical protein
MVGQSEKNLGRNVGQKEFKDKLSNIKGNKDREALLRPIKTSISRHWIITQNPTVA